MARRPAAPKPKPDPKPRPEPKPVPLPRPEPKPTGPSADDTVFWLVWWRDRGVPDETEWQAVRHFVGPLSDGVLRRFLGREGADACRDDLVRAGKEARVERAPDGTVEPRKPAV